MLGPGSRSAQDLFKHSVDSERAEAMGSEPGDGGMYSASATQGFSGLEEHFSMVHVAPLWHPMVQPPVGQLRMVQVAPVAHSIPQDPAVQVSITQVAPAEQWLMKHPISQLPMVHVAPGPHSVMLHPPPVHVARLHVARVARATGTDRASSTGARLQPTSSVVAAALQIAAPRAADHRALGAVTGYRAAARVGAIHVAGGAGVAVRLATQTWPRLSATARFSPSTRKPAAWHTQAGHTIAHHPADLPVYEISAMVIVNVMGATILMFTK
jgi:hypothetical protein